MARLYVVDQFLRDFQGHNFGYSMAVAAAAAQAGLQPVVAANRDLRIGGAAGGVRVLAWFDHPGHASRPPAQRRAPGWPAWLRRDHVLVLAARRHPAFLHLWHRFGNAAARPPLWRWRCPSALAALGRTLRDLWHGRTRRQSDAARRFAGQVCGLLSSERVTADDHLLVHTLTFAELAALRDALVLLRPETLPRIHLVLRNDPDLDPPDFALGRCLEGFRAGGLWPGRVVFYSDTPELAAIYDGFSTVRFRVLPIPLWHAEGAGPEPAAVPDGGRPLTAVYLGDARTEKGYHRLPGLVRDLWPDLIRPGRLRIVAQSNFNVHGGEPGIAEARNQLMQFPEDRVRLLTEPLSDGEYRRLVEEADLVVLPYDPQRYRARSSGVVAEAIALGKPLVVPAGTWLSAHAPPDAAVVFDGPGGLAAAVRAAVDRHAALAAAARAAAADWRRSHSAAALVRTLLEADDPAATAGPAVLYIMDADCFLFRTGSSSVARNQLAYLRRCGYRVFGVFLSMDVANPGYDEDHWRRELERALPEDLARVWLLSHRPRLAGWPTAARMLEWIRRGEHSLERSLAVYDGFAIPDDLRRFARDGGVRGVFLNYVAGLRLVDRLGLGNRPVLCETHDVQAFQYAHYGRRPVDEAEYRRECALLDRCAAVITLNELEADKLALSLRRAKLFDIRPLIDGRPSHVGELAGHADLGSLVSSCGLEPGREAVAGRLARESHIDLLFVSTWHWPNIVSFRWFYHEVFLPFLAERGVTVVVAGNIDLTLPEITHPQVFFTGRVADLRPLYAAARLVLLPIRIGAGFNIKTMEALAFGKPVAATGFAMRSVAYDRERLPTPDEPEDFAALVLRLLSDPDARAAAAAHALEVAQANNRPDRYDELMNAACQAAWGAGVPQVAPRRPVPPPQDRPPCEWTAAVRRFNRHRLGLREEDATMVRIDLARPGTWAVAEALYAAGGGGAFADYARERLGIAAPPDGEPAFVRQLRSAGTIGQVDGVDGTRLTGWLLDTAAPGAFAGVAVYEEERLVAEGRADRARPDLRAAELGLGAHGFQLPLPPALADGKPHTLRIRAKDRPYELPGSPVTVQLDRADFLRGHVDGTVDGHVCGWVWDELAPAEPQWVELRVDGRTVVRALADQFRDDLKTAGIGDGRHAFRIPLPPALAGVPPGGFAVVPSASNRPLPASAGASRAGTLTDAA